MAELTNATRQRITDREKTLSKKLTEAEVFMEAHKHCKTHEDLTEDELRELHTIVSNVQGPVFRNSPLFPRIVRFYAWNDSLGGYDI